MTVLEIDAITVPKNLTPLPVEALQNHSVQACVLFCPNINDLPMPHFQKADRCLNELNEALLTQNVESFNRVKAALVSLLKKYDQPITQWNPLILEFSNAQLLQGAQLENIDFSMTVLRALSGTLVLDSANLRKARLLCTDLSQTSLLGTNLSAADLRYADLRDVNLTLAQLSESNLSHAKLSNAKLDGANLHRAQLNGTLLKQASLEKTNLRRAELRHCDLYLANLREARLQHADLRESNLFMADLTRARLRQADLRQVNLGFSALKEARLQEARLEGSNLGHANMEAADLRKCRFTSVQTERALMRGANLADAELQGADFTLVRELQHAILCGAHYDHDTRFPHDFQTAGHDMNNVQGEKLIWTLRRFIRQKRVTNGRMLQPQLR